MKVGIALDRWKVATFRKHLDEAKYSYQESRGAGTDPDTITVEIDETPEAIEALTGVIGIAHRECTRMKLH